MKEFLSSRTTRKLDLQKATTFHLQIFPDTKKMQKLQKKLNFFMHLQGKNVSCSCGTKELTKGSPCYSGLTNNVSTPLLQTTLLPFGEDVPDYVSHTVLGGYIQQISKTTGVDQVTRYNTRVEDAVKRNGLWQLRTSTLEDNSQSKGIRIVESQSV
jgi:hypothetical protein